MATELHTQRRHRLLPILIMLAVLATSSPIAVGNPQAVRAQAEPCVVGDDNFDAGIDSGAWHVSEDGGATVSHASGRVVMTLPAEASGDFIAAQLVSTC